MLSNVVTSTIKQAQGMLGAVLKNFMQSLKIFVNKILHL